MRIMFPANLPASLSPSFLPSYAQMHLGAFLPHELYIATINYLLSIPFVGPIAKGRLVEVPTTAVL